MATTKLATDHLDVFYGDFPALKQVTVAVAQRQITALIGPSGCGKSTLLRVFNRMNDLIPGFRLRGTAALDGASLYAPHVDIDALRKRVGMVFQRPNPFPLSILDNVTYGPVVHGLVRRDQRQSLAQESLGAVGLWDELKDRLADSALSLTLEQMQRLCIARALAARPEVLLMDEPCSALDPIATLRIEGLMKTLARLYTLLVVTHNMQQAARISDQTGFLLAGELIEVGPTSDVFLRPRDKRTEDYVTGRYG